MINEQEMQFADPDWKPTGSLPASPVNGGASAGIPAPVSASSAVSTNQPPSTSSASLPSYQEGYQGAWQAPQPSSPLSAVSPQAQQMPYQGVATRGRRRGRWGLLIVVILLFFFIAGGLSVFSHAGHSNGAYRMDAPPMQAPPLQNYALKGATELDINDLSGNVVVKTVDDGKADIQVVSAQGSAPKVFYQGQSMVLTSDDDLTILIPQNVALKLSGGMNALEVDNFTGQLTAQTNSGNITLNNDHLTGGSSLNTNSGDIDQETGSIDGAIITSSTGSITLNQVDLSGQVTVSTGGNGTITYTGGTLAPTGKYQFTSDSGSISLELPDGTAMQMKVSQKGGHFSSDFPPATGSAPQAELDITTNSGDITIGKN